MKRNRTLSVAMTVIVACSKLTFAEDASEMKQLNLFDGTPKTFVVNGYSTSYDWPAVLQRKLDKFFDGKRIIEVKKATQGGTPIAKWMNLDTGQPNSPWIKKLRPLLKEKQQPTIVLGQQSLQWVFGSRSAGIESATDSQRIQSGSKAIQQYTDMLLADGADAVVLAMHIYKQSMEPEIGNERLALEAFMKSEPQNVFAGPDVWEPTSKLWPQAFKADKVHPNEMGAEVMAHYWFATLLKLDGRDVPAWSENEMKQAINNPPKQETKRTRSRSIPPFLIKKYDKDGDGKLNDVERKVFEQDRQRRRNNR